jgi:preprotein translocase subunit SecG
VNLIGSNARDAMGFPSLFAGRNVDLFTASTAALVNSKITAIIRISFLGYALGSPNYNM